MNCYSQKVTNMEEYELESFNEENDTETQTDGPVNEDPYLFDFKGIREKNGMSIEDIAELLGITPGHVKKIERKVVPLTDEIAKKFSELYQMDIRPYRLPKIDTPEVNSFEPKTIIPSKKLDLFSDSSGKALNLALKRKHAKAANKLMSLYQKIGDIRAIVDSVFLEGGDD